MKPFIITPQGEDRNEFVEVNDNSYSCRSWMKLYAGYGLCPNLPQKNHCGFFDFTLLFLKKSTFVMNLIFLRAKNNSFLITQDIVC